MVSIADVVDWVEHSKYQTELQEHILDWMPNEGEARHPCRTRLELSHLRTAWHAPQILAEKKKKCKLEGATEDVEEPIDESTRTDLLAAFTALHSLLVSMF